MSNALNELRQVHRQAVADGMVKVGLPMADSPGGVEWCFGQRLSATRARLDNVPVFSDVAHYGDVVEFREQDPSDELLKAFVGVKSQGSQTVVLPYGDDDEPLPRDEVRRRFDLVRERLLALPEPIRPLAVEGVVDGWVAVALPLGLTRRQVRAVVRSIPEWQGEG